MVELAARADAHEESRRDRPARDSDLPGAWQPTLVGDFSCRPDLGTEQRAQGFERVVLVGAHTAADADHRRRFRERVEIVVAGASEDAYAAARFHLDVANICLPV